MELDTSDVGSEIQELEEPGLEEPELEEPELEEQELEEQELEEPELEELYESAEPPRERNRGIDDSMVSAFLFQYSYHNLLTLLFSRSMRIVNSSELICAYHPEYPKEMPK